jgi:dihydroneopterin aldolase
MEPNNLYRIFVKDLELFCFIGIHPHEKEKPQRVLINLEITFEKILCDKDEIDSVVSYEDVIDKIKKIMDQGHINLVESFAERIAHFCLQDSRVHKVCVSVEKPDIFQDAKSVGVMITRERS